MRSLVALAAELEAVRGQARGQATRIRLRAMRDAAELAERMAELERRPPGGRDRLIDSLREGIARLAGGRGARPRRGRRDERAGRPTRRTSCSRAWSRSRSARWTTSRSWSGSRTPPGGIADDVGDLGETVRVAGGRHWRCASHKPVELLRELEERSPFEFRVRDRRFDRLVLDVDDGEQRSARQRRRLPGDPARTSPADPVSVRRRCEHVFVLTTEREGKHCGGRDCGGGNTCRRRGAAPDHRARQIRPRSRGRRQPDQSPVQVGPASRIGRCRPPVRFSLYRNRFCTDRVHGRRDRRCRSILRGARPLLSDPDRHHRRDARGSAASCADQERPAGGAKLGVGI